MTFEQIENLKEILICASDDLTSLTNIILSMNKKLESEKVNILKIQNQLSIASCLIPEMEKTINRLNSFIKESAAEPKE